MIEVKRDDFFVESIKNPIEYGTYYKINPICSPTIVSWLNLISVTVMMKSW